MKGLASVAQMRKGMRVHDYPVPSASAIYSLLKIKGLKAKKTFEYIDKKTGEKREVGYYNSLNSWTTIKQNWEMLWDFESGVKRGKIYTQQMIDQIKKHGPHPWPQKGISKASSELLKGDDVSYGDVEESIVRKYIIETIDELELYHGSDADFDEFNIAYIGSGSGRQDYGFGWYASSSYRVALSYGNKVYVVKLPDEGWLEEELDPKVAMSIAEEFYEYYVTKDPYGIEAYPTNELRCDFWDMECKYIGECESGESLYGTISSILGSDEFTSEFLRGIGYVGLKLESHADNAGEEYCNYVIFDEKDIKILEVVRY